MGALEYPRLVRVPERYHRVGVFSTDPARGDSSRGRREIGGRRHVETLFPRDRIDRSVVLDTAQVV